MKDIAKFIKINEGKPDHVKVSHKTYLFEKKKNQSRWFCKELGQDKREAMQEVIAQEFFRLLYPPSPKTRWAKKNSKYYVLSKEIPQFNALFFSESKKNHGSYFHISGLLSVQVISLILGEVDFKAGNVGVNSENQVIKIDGGWSFPTEKGLERSSDLEKFINFTQDDIQSLPIVIDYQPYNWLKLIRYNEYLDKSFYNKDSDLFISCKEYSSFFERERNKIILFMCSLPDTLINAFTKSYHLDDYEAENLAQFIIKRRNKLRDIAENIPSYLSYRESSEAKEDITIYINYLMSFKTFGKKILLKEIKNKFNIDVEIIIKDYILIRNFYRQFKADLFIIGVIIKDEFFNKIADISSPLVKVIEKYINDSLNTNRAEVYEALIELKSQLTKLEFLDNNLFISRIENCIKNLEVISNEGLNQSSKNTSAPLTNNFSKGIMFRSVNKRKHHVVLSSFEQAEDELNKISSKQPRAF